MTGIDDIIRDAQNEAGEAHRWARINQVLYYLFGLLAIVAGLVAGLTAAAEWQKFITAAAGFLAAILAGFQTFLDTRKKADSYGKRNATSKI